MEENWLNNQEARAWRGFVVASQTLMTQLERDLVAGSGLSMADYAVLVSLSEVENRRLRSTELADRMSWSRSRLSHQVGRMESRGLVKRENCGSDARGSYIVLTDQGLSTIGDAAPGHVESVRKHLFDYLSDAQIEALGDISTAIVDHLHAHGALPSECDSAAITKSQTTTDA